MDHVLAQADGGAVLALNPFPYVTSRGKSHSRRQGPALYFVSPEGLSRGRPRALVESILGVLEITEDGYIVVMADEQLFRGWLL